MAKNTMETWVKREENDCCSTKKMLMIFRRYFYNLIDKLVLDPNKLATIKIKANQFDQDFEHLDQLFEKIYSD